MLINMNIIQTNFASRADEIIRNSVVGGTLGSVTGLVTRMGDHDISHIDALAKGGLGGAAGAVIGGLISNERIFGPAVGTFVGGVIGSKMAKRKSIKDLVKRIYADAASGDDMSRLVSQTNPLMFSEGDPAIKNEIADLDVEIAEQKQEIARLDAERNDVSEQVKVDSVDSSRNASIDTSSYDNAVVTPEYTFESRYINDALSAQNPDNVEERSGNSNLSNSTQKFDRVSSSLDSAKSNLQKLYEEKKAKKERLSGGDTAKKKSTTIGDDTASTYNRDIKRISGVFKSGSAIKTA